MNAITKPTFATAAATALRETLTAARGPLRDGINQFRAASAGLTPDADLLKVLKAAGAVVLAAEAITTASKEAEAAARSALTAAMSETGCSSVALPSHTVHISKRPVFVSIDRFELVPADFMRQPPAIPDKKAIRAAIEAGTEVPGCSLVRPNEAICVFKGRFT